MLRIALCDDERVFRNDLKKMISTELDLCGIDYIITEFTCGEDMLEAFRRTDYHVIFLDIEMKGLDGISAAKELRARKDNAAIIFVTSHPDFVFQGYEVRAVNYILKPYEKDKIISVLHAALEDKDISLEKYYHLEQQGGSISLPLSSVIYFFSDKRIVHAVTQEREYTFYGKLNEVELKVPNNFFRIHSRYLVNLKYLREIKGYKAYICREELPISRPLRQELSIAFAKYMLG